MKIRLILIAAAAAMGISFAASAAPAIPAAQSGMADNSKSTLSLVHWRRHNRRHSHWHHGPLCLFSLAPWCWR
jgi:hypothetical protein